MARPLRAGALPSAVVALAASLAAAGTPGSREGDQVASTSARMAEYLAASQARQARMAAAREGLAGLAGAKSRYNFTHDDYWRSGMSQGVRHGDREFFPVLAKHPEVLQRLEKLFVGALTAGAARSSLRIIQIGAGVSPLAEELLRRGFTGLVSTDVSPTAINNLRKKASHLGGSYVVADATNLRDFRDGSFDVVIEKGALDALTSDPGNRTEQAIQQFARVLAPGGIFCSVTGIGVDGEPSPKILPHVRAAFPAVEVTRIEMVPGEPRPAHLLHASMLQEVRV